MRFLSASVLLALLLLARLSPASIDLSKQLSEAGRDLTIRTDTLTLLDKTRDRKIPLAIYQPEKAVKKMKVAIISHGYNQNQGKPYKGYSFIANYLASKGYFVASIQHELPTDELIPMTGPIYQTRLPFWERGVTNILFVVNELKRMQPDLDFSDLVLIGHSNGGDMSMLLAQEHPEVAAKVISLDNRRVPLPRTKRPRIFSMRSSDQPADEGVLPSEEEQKQFGITVVKLPDTIHNVMSDQGSEAQKKEMLDHISAFLHLN